MKLLEERGDWQFEEAPGAKQAFELRDSVRKLVSAVMDGGRGTDEATMKRISEVLNKARREVYSILAES